jgi:FkbM family methyltransferase
MVVIDLFCIRRLAFGAINGHPINFSEPTSLGFTMNYQTTTNRFSATDHLLQALLMRLRPAWLASYVKRALRTGRREIDTPHGRFWVDPVSHLGFEIARTGAYEPSMRRTLETHLAPGDVFVDLGANEGYFSVIGARLVGEKGRVVAIEPQERLSAVIAANLALNGLESVHVAQVAITDSPAPVTLYLTPDINTGSTGLHRSLSYNLPTQRANAQTLSALLDSLGLDHVDLMKVDIEGFEYEALLGSPEVFRQHRIRAIALELHPAIIKARGKDDGDITAMLSQYGYRQTDSFGCSVWIASDSASPEH